MLLKEVDYLNLGRQVADLLGSALEGPSVEALRELARVYDPSADEVRIKAEVFLFHKYVLMQACTGVFAESQVDHVVGGLFAALNERAGWLELSPDRQEAMERMWQQRVREFDQPFSKDRADFLDDGVSPLNWKGIILQFCQNVREIESPSDLWADDDGPSHAASGSVTTAFSEMVAALGEINQRHFSGAV
ncbi:MAG: hypothetical protein HP491_17650 [Nitrospira sp.]|nr:hypothetical protein [Nitrospira sp.]MBH0183502.1 hypothetical protein [Nitrospira sp.]MBH0186765.1 hypothetical protein [Nitrospira sp.]